MWVHSEKWVVSMHCLTEMTGEDKERIVRAVRQHAGQHDGFAHIIPCISVVAEGFAQAVGEACVFGHGNGAYPHQQIHFEALATELVQQCQAYNGSLDAILVLIHCFRFGYLNHLAFCTQKEPSCAQHVSTISELHDLLLLRVTRLWEDVRHEDVCGSGDEESVAEQAFWVLPDPVLVHTRQGNIIAVNPAACTFFGFSEERFKALRLLDIEAPRPSGGQGGSSPLPAPGGVERYQTVFILASKRRVPCDVRCKAIPSHDSGLFISTVRDISQSKNAEKELRDASKLMELRSDENLRRLRETNTRFQAVLDYSPMAFFLVDREQRHLVANNAWCALLDKSQEQVLGKTFLDVLPISTAHDFAERLTMMEQQQQFLEFEDKLLLGNREVWVACTMFPVRNEVEGISTYCGVLMDITASVEARTMARRLARQNALVLNSAGEGIFGVDQNGLTSFVNPAAATMLGWDMEEMVGSHSHTMWHHSDVDGLPRPPSACPLCRVLFTGKPAHGDDEIFWRKDGSFFPVSYTAAPLRNGAHIEGVVVTFSDSSERKRIKRQLMEAKERAELGDQAKTEFLSNMSHELRTPLNGILGLVQLMLENERDKEKREHLGMVREASERLLGLVRNLLDLSKLTAGEVQSTKTQFALRQSLSNLVETYTVQAKLKSLEFSCFIEEELPEHWVGDGAHMKQVLNNLLKNAIQYTASGRVVLDIRKEPQPPEGKAMLRFTVTDTGIGVQEELQEQIFESFALGEDYLTKRHSGPGLGLSIASKLVDMLGGELKMSSKPQVGSVFSFTVPFEPYVSEETEPFSSALRILYAEDEYATQRMVQGILAQAGHHVEVVSNGQEALDVLARQQFDLVLMDIQMPQMDGLETTLRIRKHLKLDVPIIALTAFADETDRSPFAKAGMDGLLHKPFDLGELYSVLKQRTALLPAS